ncbi:hypothetical protein FEDK69T_20680 [Flavobacterium enshiense DK69]|nr:hypothetical protein FEDK69T_20680 [Flavobacterium enshiense DK69]
MLFVPWRIFFKLFLTTQRNNKFFFRHIAPNKKSPDGKRPMIVHNVGAGQVLEDYLFSYKTLGIINISTN